jgi:hypothetical protein
MQLGGAMGYPVTVRSGANLHNEGFVAGSSGWIVYADGTVEFNNGTFRGALEASSIDINDAWKVDISGNMWWGAAATYAAATTKISSAGVVDFGSTTTGFHLTAAGDAYFGGNASNYVVRIDADGQVEIKSTISDSYMYSLTSEDLTGWAFNSGTGIAIGGIQFSGNTVGDAAESWDTLMTSGGTGATYIDLRGRAADSSYLGSMHLHVGGYKWVINDSDGSLTIGSSDDGLGPVTGSVGSVQTVGSGAGGYEGYNIQGRLAFVENGSDGGIYDDVNNRWKIRTDIGASGATALYYGTDTAAKLSTSSTGVTIAGLPIIQRANSELLRLQDTTSTNRSGFIGFHDSAGTDRVGYVGFAGNDDLYVYAEEAAGNLFFGARQAVRVKVDNASMSPNVTEVYNLGSTTKEWNNIYTQNAVTVSDDRRKVRLPAKNMLGLDFLLDLQPFAGRRKGKANREIHQYLSAQEVRAALVKHGHDPVKSALWEESSEEEGSVQALRQGELTPVMITSIKELHRRIAALEAAAA